MAIRLAHSCQTHGSGRTVCSRQNRLEERLFALYAMIGIQDATWSLAAGAALNIRVSTQLAHNYEGGRVTNDTDYKLSVTTRAIFYGFGGAKVVAGLINLVSPPVFQYTLRFS